MILPHLIKSMRKRSIGLSFQQSAQRCLAELLAQKEFCFGEGSINRSSHQCYSWRKKVIAPTGHLTAKRLLKSTNHNKQVINHEEQRLHVCVWRSKQLGTHIAESVDGALDDERGRDEESEHGGDRPRRRERQRPHLPLPRHSGLCLAARHLLLSSQRKGPRGRSLSSPPPQETGRQEQPPLRITLQPVP